MRRGRVAGSWPARVAALLGAASLVALGGVIWLVAAVRGDAGMRVRDVSSGAPAYLARNITFRTVVGVTPGGPAAAAGLRAGDRIVAWKNWQAHELRAGGRVAL